MITEQESGLNLDTPTKILGGKSYHECRMRRFFLYRKEDVSGVSGTGIVADGVEFPDGSVTLKWRGETSSTVSWRNMQDVEKVHGHDRRTEVIYVDEYVVYTELPSNLPEDLFQLNQLVRGVEPFQKIYGSIVEFYDTRDKTHNRRQVRVYGHASHSYHTFAQHMLEPYTEPKTYHTGDEVLVDGGNLKFRGKIVE